MCLNQSTPRAERSCSFHALGIKMHGHLVREKLAHCSKPCVVLGDFLDGGYWAQVFYSLLVASETTEKELVSFGGFLAFHWITHQYVQTSLDIPQKKVVLEAGSCDCRIQFHEFNCWLKAMGTYNFKSRFRHIIHPHSCEFLLDCLLKPIQSIILWVAMLPIF